MEPACSLNGESGKIISFSIPADTHRAANTANNEDEEETGMELQPRDSENAPAPKQRDNACLIEDACRDLAPLPNSEDTGQPSLPGAYPQRWTTSGHPNDPEGDERPVLEDHGLAVANPVELSHAEDVTRR